MISIAWRAICRVAGHDWLYRRDNANRRFCRRCARAEWLHFWSNRTQSWEVE